MSKELVYYYFSHNVYFLDFSESINVIGKLVFLLECTAQLRSLLPSVSFKVHHMPISAARTSAQTQGSFSVLKSGFTVRANKFYFRIAQKMVSCATDLKSKSYLDCHTVQIILSALYSEIMFI